MKRMVFFLSAICVVAMTVNSCGCSSNQEQPETVSSEVQDILDDLADGATQEEIAAAIEELKEAGLTNEEELAGLINAAVNAYADVVKETIENADVEEVMEQFAEEVEEKAAKFAEDAEQQAEKLAKDAEKAASAAVDALKNLF